MQNRPQWLVKFLDFLLDNIALLATIVFASYVIYMKEFQGAAVTTDQLLTAILAVLGLLAISEVVERNRKLSKIEKANERAAALIESHIVGKPSAKAFFEPPPVDELEGLIKNAHTIDLCGFSLTATLNKQFSNLRERLAHGATIRILVADPSPNALAIQMGTLRSEDPTNTDYFTKRLSASFEDIKYLHKSLTDSQAKPATAVQQGKLAVKLLQFAPSFGILTFDAGQTNGRIIVEIYSHVSGYETPVVFSLDPKRDGEWYHYFQRQFDDLWRVSKDWNPSV